MTEAWIKTDTDGDLAIVTIDRPERRNAITGPMWTALREAAEALEKSPPRAVILKGQGEHFSAGMDLKLDNPLMQRVLPAVAEKNTDTLREVILELKAVTGAFLKLPCPVIAAIEGACAGGGLEMALGTDLRVAGKSAFFSLPEAQVGMMPDVGGTVRTLYAVGPVRAAELLLSGRRLTADEALAWGLINRVTEDDKALEGAKALAKELSTAAPQATREILSTLRSMREDEAALGRETEAGIRTLLSGELVEGGQAFMEKRPPKWSA